MRDFRDAKTMAQSLRKALTADALTVTHSQSLELIAQAFGLENWNTLSAKIEADRATRPAPSPPTGKTLYCSFCGKSQHDVQTLIAGPDVQICNECVGLCDGILADGKLTRQIAEARARDPAADPKEAAAEVFRQYGDDPLLEYRRANADWLEHIVWSIGQTTARLEGREPAGPWRPDETAKRRGWTRDPLAGKSRTEIAAHKTQLEAQRAQISERLQLMEKVLAERGLS